MKHLIHLKKNAIFVSNNSFMQNPLISKELRYDVMDLLKSCLTTKIITCIGGESYIYALCNDNTKYIYHYTNSKSIANDLYLNNHRYRKNIDNNIINYNIFKNIKNADILIINLAKLNINILQIVNARFYKYIIIINCHHSEFWKRKHILSNYKLIHRNKYITNNYFVTVNLFKYNSIKKEFISLGGNCSVAFQLKNIGIRFNSYPFDWAKINISQLNNILDNDFKDFHNLSIKKLSHNHNYKFIDNQNSFLLTNPYKIIFAHEIPFNNNQDIVDSNIVALKEKFNRRINRFRNLNSMSNTKVTFVLFNFYNNDTNLIKLINNLKKYISEFSVIYILLDNNNTLDNNRSDLDYCYFYKIINRIKVNYIKISYNSIDWTDWSFSKLDWYNIIFNKL